MTRTLLFAAAAASFLIATACTQAPPPATAEARGQQVFAGRGCGGCHAIRGMAGAAGAVGPELTQVARVAGDRVPGLSAEEYLRRQITEPEFYTVPGYSRGVMPRFPLSDQEVDDLVAFLLTLE